MAEQEVVCWAGSRVEISHLPFRRNERAVLKYRQMETLQKSALVCANVHNHFNLALHLINRQTYKERRSAALAERPPISENRRSCAEWLLLGLYS